MTAYLVKRALALPLTLLGVSVVTFVFLRLIPGDAGLSIRSGQPVTSEVAARLPVTVELALAAALVAVALGVPLGLVSALKPGHAIDLLARGFGLIGLALPNFWLGTLAILLFAR